MELLDRYLQAVREYLLSSRRDDVVKELGDNILSQMEEGAAELGRPLSENEQPDAQNSERSRGRANFTANVIYFCGALCW